MGDVKPMRTEGKDKNKKNDNQEQLNDSLRTDSNSPNKKDSLRGSIEEEKEFVLTEKQKNVMAAKKSVRGSMSMVKRETKMPKVHTFKDLSHLSYFGSKSKMHESTSRYNDNNTQNFENNGIS